MIRVLPAIIACTVFVALTTLIPMIGYNAIFEKAMDPDPHGVGAFLWMMFAGLLSPFVSFWVSVGFWLWLRQLQRTQSQLSIIDDKKV